MTTPIPPTLLALPHGLTVSGVTMWAVRLANALAARGGRVALVSHTEATSHARLDIPLCPGVEHVRLDGVAPMDHANGDLTPYLPAYVDAIDRLAAGAGPVIVSPNLVGDCYGVCAAIASSRPDLVRVVGWAHNDTEYDCCVLEHYEPLLAAFVGVSEHIAANLARRLPTRAGAVHRIPYGVEVPSAPPTREPLDGRPLRLLYTGRIDHYQKRIGVLPEISRALDARGVAHELLLLGDGPATGEIDAILADLPHCRREPGVGPGGVRKRLAWADCFVLASRFEGLSISMLEALAAGCCPVVAKVESGASEAIDDGRTGLLVPTGEDDDATLGDIFAHRIAELGATPDRLDAMQRAAWEHARERYSVDAHAERVIELFRAVAARPGRAWPADRPCGFTSSSNALSDATVPTDAGVRLRRMLEQIVRERGPAARVALWGAGRHTIALAAELARPAAEVVCILDDDAKAHGERLWGLPIVGVASLAGFGVTDVVISSWMHQSTMWKKRAPVEATGATVRRLYPDAQHAAGLRLRPAAHAATSPA
ncbi:MAG: glycosyltransferase [Phycisphaerales bacterium]